MCAPETGSGPRPPPAGAVRAPRPAQPRGPRVALPSQGSQVRAREKTLAGGISGCWENGFTETAFSKARAIAGTLPGPGRGDTGGAVRTASARRARRDRGAQEQSGPSRPLAPPCPEHLGVIARPPGACRVRRSPWRCGRRPRTPARLAWKRPPRGPGAPLIG